MTVLIPALLLGLASSLHCVGMCGPLMLALPLGGAGIRHVWGQLLVYHTGRILTYAVLGLLFGSLGMGLAVAGLQQTLSIAAGLFMLGMAVMAWRLEHLVTSLPGLGRLSDFVKNTMNRLLRRRGGMFALGMLNGLLPCGMVYAALAGSIATGGYRSGTAFMAVFGLGTIPLLLGVHFLGKKLNRTALNRVRLLQPLLLAAIGLLLLQRGLRLDLSLFQSAVPPAELDCH